MLRADSSKSHLYRLRAPGISAPPPRRLPGGALRVLTRHSKPPHQQEDEHGRDQHRESGPDHHAQHLRDERHWLRIACPPHRVLPGGRDALNPILPRPRGGHGWPGARRPHLQNGSARLPPRGHRSSQRFGGAGHAGKRSSSRTGAAWSRGAAMMRAEHVGSCSLRGAAQPPQPLTIPVCSGASISSSWLDRLSGRPESWGIRSRRKPCESSLWARPSPAASPTTLRTRRLSGFSAGQGTARGAQRSRGVGHLTSRPRWDPTLGQKGSWPSIHCQQPAHRSPKGTASSRKRPPSRPLPRGIDQS